MKLITKVLQGLFGLVASGGVARTSRRRGALALLVGVLGVLGSIGLPARPTFASTAISISPTSGPIGTLVTVTGSGFVVSASVTVSVSTSSTTNGNTVTTCAATSTGAIGTCTFNWPSFWKAGATYYVIVTDTAGHRASASFLLKPRIILTPTSGPIGTSVNVYGDGFTSSWYEPAVGPWVDVYWNSSSGTKLSSCNISYTSGIGWSGSFSCNVTVPSGSVAGKHTVYVVDDRGNSATAPFTVTAQIALSPTSGHVGTKVTVSGNGFAAGKSLAVYWNWNGTSGTKVASCSTNSGGGVGSGCTFTVPSTASLASYVVYAVDGAGNSTTATFTVN